MSIEFGTIKRRQIALSTSGSYNESTIQSKIDNLANSIEAEVSSEHGTITPNIRNQMNSFIECIGNGDQASRYIDECLYFIGESNKIDKIFGDSMTAQAIMKVIPSASLESYSRIQSKYSMLGLTEQQMVHLNEAIQQCTVAERILINHENMSRRFNIDKYFKQHKHNVARITENLCNMIATYSNVTPYQKLNLCIEELAYLYGKEGKKLDWNPIVESVTKHVLLTNKISLSELGMIKRALQESYVLKESDLDQVQFIITQETSSNTVGFTEAFLLNPNKDYVSVHRMCDKIAQEASAASIINQLQYMTDLLAECLKLDIVDEVGTQLCMEDFYTQLAEREDIGEKEWNQIIESADKCCNSSILTAHYNLSEDQMKIDVFKKYMCKMRDQFKESALICYDEANLDAMSFKEDCQVIPLQEFKLFKFNNLIKAAFNLDKFLKIKSRQALTKPKEKILHFVRKARNVLFGEATELKIAEYGHCIYEFVGDANYVDGCVCQYEYTQEEEADVKQFLSEACHSFNDSLLIESTFDTKAYYVINPGVAEVRIRQNIQLELSEEDAEILKDYVSKDMDIYNEFYVKGMEELEKASKHIFEFNEYISEFCNNQSMTREHLEEAVQIAADLGMSDDDLKFFEENFKSTIARRELLTEEVKNSDWKNITWKRDENLVLSEMEQLEAYNLMTAVLEALPEIKKPEIKAPDLLNKKKPEDKKDDKGDGKGDGEKKKLINLTDIRLSMEGLKDQLANASQKEKEISKDLDMSAGRLMKGIKDALISDRREAIIKGSVIPSFSKCIKIGIALAGAGIITGNPIVPIIAAVGGFAMSKKLTHRERLLLLDDIDIELDVVEKEIQNAESKNQMKKYRALLRYKKDLQRQYQRIKYNVRVGKDIMPNSTMGLKKVD